MSESALLVIKDLDVFYGPVQANRSVSIQVNQGTIVALLGANGAGKTTLLRSISGVVPPQSGTIHFRGRPIHQLPPEKITHLGISQSPEGRQIFNEITVLENLMIGAYSLKNKANIAKNLDRVVNYFPRLKERYQQQANTLSGGEQQMLAIGRALMSSPELLLLDEPSLGLAPIISREIMKIIQEIVSDGTTVLIVEQNAVQTLKIADYGYVMDVGKVVKEGPAQTLLTDTTLIEAYLGAQK